MAVGVVVGVVGAAVVAGGVALVATADDAGSGAAPRAAEGVPLPVSEVSAGGVRAPTGAAAAGEGSGLLGDVAGKVLDKAAEKALNTLVGGGVASTLTMGVQYADAMRQVVTAVAGVGAGNTAAVVSGAGVGFIVKSGVEAAGSALGIPADINRRIAQTAGIAVADPTGIATSVKVASELVSLGIRAVAGEQVERTVRDAVKVFDITDSKNVVHAPIAAVASGVTAAANAVKNGVSSLFKGLFGK